MLSSIRSDIIKKLFSLPRQQPTLKKSEVSLLFHEPGIESGYRPLNKPWSYYFISAFQVHNESMNVWTHFVGFFVVLEAMSRYHQELDFNREEMFPMVIFGVCCLLFSMLSTCAHLLEAKSLIVHNVAYLVDYAGVGLYGFGTMTIVYYYAVTDGFVRLVGPYVMPVNTFMAVFCCFCCCYAKLNYMRPYPVQRKIFNIGGNGCHFLLYACPLFYRMLIDDGSQPSDIRAIVISKTLLATVAFFTSVFFFATHLPEKWYPGKFDIFGHSHAYFHAFVIITVLLQFDIASFELQNRDTREALTSLAKPYSLFFYLLAVVTADAIIIIGFYGKAKEMAAKYTKQT